MPSLKHIRQRIQSVKSTQQITRAMKMVAAARLRKASERLVQMRPYAASVRDMIAHIAARTDARAHPLLVQRPKKRAQLIVLTSDRGLCGAFNMNVSKQAFAYYRREGLAGILAKNRAAHDHVELALIGKKGIEFFTRRSCAIRHRYLDILTEPTLERAQEIGTNIVGDYIDGALDSVYLVYNEFKSAITQQVVVEQLLPLGDAPVRQPDTATAQDGANQVDFIYEPDKRAILDALLPMYVNVQIYRAVLESLAGEMGARMTAMDSSTRNAGELIDRLTLQYNRARQAAITTELMEIIGGAEALKQA